MFEISFCVPVADVSDKKTNYEVNQIQCA